MEVTSIKVPPENILNTEIKNFEHIILWMLKNNDGCQWSDFVSDPVNISGSTLSGYLNSLMELHYIEKLSLMINNRKRKIYRILPEGERRFIELSTFQSEEVKLNYPPQIILNRRNYDHWILWMVYNNTTCKWADFLDDPLNINQSSLSKNLNKLMSLNLVIKNEREKDYSITQAGKIEYSRMLRKYDLDRQSILEEESKRIEEIVGKIKDFFAGKQIQDDIKFRFLSNVLKLDYSKVKDILPNETDFFKIILYLSINHPIEYPNYTPLKKLARDYQIEERILNYYIPEIVENDLYPIKFFKLNVEGSKDYFFRSDDEFEKSLRTLVDGCITKLTYLNKLYKGTSKEIPESRFYDKIIENITNKASGKLIPEELKESMKKFLPKYIHHLLYKFDTETEIKKSVDKFDALAYDTMSHIFQALKPVSAFEQTGEEGDNYFVDSMIFKFLKPIKNCKLDLIKQKLFESKPKGELMDLVDSALKISPNDRELKLLRAIVLCILRRYNEAIKYLNKETNFEEIVNNKEDFITTSFIIAYANIGIGRYSRAGEVRGDVLKRFPKDMIAGLLNAFIYAYNMIYVFDPDTSTEEEFHYTMNKLIEREQDEENKAEMYIFYGYILHLTEHNKEALEKVNNALELNPISDYFFHKVHYLYDLGYINEAIDVLEKIGKDFPEKEDMIKFKIASLYYKLGKTLESKELLEEIINRNPNEYDYFNSYIYTLAHLNLKDETIKNAEYLIENGPDNGNYFDSYGEVLMMFGNYEDAITKFKKALELEPDGWFVYETYIKMGRCQMKLGFPKEAINNFKKGKSYIQRNLPCCKKHFTWVEKADRYLEKLNAI